jgi:hypothetical protein
MSDDPRSVRRVQDDDIQLWKSGVWGDYSDTPLPLRASAAGYAASQASAIGIGATTEDSDSYQAVPEADVLARGVVINAEPGKVTFTGVPATRTLSRKAQTAALPPGEGHGGRLLKSLFPRSYSSIYYPVIADAQRAWYFQEKPAWRINARMWLLIMGHAIRQLAESEWIGRIAERIGRLLG